MRALKIEAAVQGLLPKRLRQRIAIPICDGKAIKLALTVIGYMHMRRGRRE